MPVREITFRTFPLRSVKTFARPRVDPNISILSSQMSCALLRSEEKYSLVY